MPPAIGPHTRGQKPGFIYRGSKKRVAKLSPFEQLPLQFWLVLAIAVFMFGLSLLLIRNS
jgi:hypothetical protein